MVGFRGVLTLPFDGTTDGLERVRQNGQTDIGGKKIEATHIPSFRQTEGGGERKNSGDQEGSERMRCDGGMARTRKDHEWLNPEFRERLDILSLFWSIQAP